jgi:hypothetical protein
MNQIQDRNIQLNSSSITCSCYCFLSLLLRAQLRLFSVDQQSNCSSPAVFHLLSLKTSGEWICLIPRVVCRWGEQLRLSILVFFFVSNWIVWRQYIISLIFSCHASYCRSEAAAGLVLPRGVRSAKRAHHQLHVLATCEYLASRKVPSILGGSRRNWDSNF